MEFKKFDNNKTMLTLIEPEFLLEMSEVLTFGANKYGKESWKLCDDSERYRNALYRHFNSYLQGEKNDVETGKSHLVHVAINAMFIDYLENKREIENVKS